MSRPELPFAPVVVPRTFFALAIGFLLFYAGVLVMARQQREARAGLETIVALPLLPEAAGTVAKPAPPPLEP